MKMKQSSKNVEEKSGPMETIFCHFFSKVYITEMRVRLWVVEKLLFIQTILEICENGLKI